MFNVIFIIVAIIAYYKLSKKIEKIEDELEARKPTTESQSMNGFKKSVGR